MISAAAMYPICVARAVQIFDVAFHKLFTLYFVITGAKYVPFFSSGDK